MFVSEKLVFTELHKTGGTHISNWLSKLVGGEQIGKHNRIPPAYWDRFIIGSIRNPWDWYVSLWAFGCGGQGSVYRETTRRIDIKYLNRQLHSEMGLPRPRPGQWIRQFWHDARKPVAKWASLYSDYSDSTAFRAWVRMMLDPARRFDMAEGFGFSPLARGFGLMTYRYLKLFTRLGDELYRDGTLQTLQGIRSVWLKKKLVNFVIRNEYLEQDMLKALGTAGISLPEQERTALLEASGKRTNTSRHLSVGHYYDKETIDLIFDREPLIIEQYGYEPPDILYKEA